MTFIEFIFSFNSLLIVLLLFFVYACLVYKIKYNVWKSQNVHGPIPLPVLGNVVDAFIHNLPFLLMQRSKKYGRVYGLYEGMKPVLCVADTELLKQIFVKDFHIFTNRRKLGSFDDVFSKMLSVTEDNDWRRLRSIITPTFSTAKIKRMKPMIEECVKNACEFLGDAAEKNEDVNLKRFWERFTLEVIACCCFATKVNSHKDPENVFFKHVTNCFRKPGPAALLFFLLPLWLFKRLNIRVFPPESIEFLKGLIIELLKRRKEDNLSHNDFLQLLIEAEKESNDKNVEPLTENEIIAQCLLFFLAGYETTATLLHYSCYALAMNEQVQEKLYNEIRSHFSNNENIEYDTANKLPYLDAVICETFRMYPPVVHTERTANSDVILGDTGIKIPSKSMVIIPIYAIHHDEQYYSDPEKFRPERFYKENREQIDNYAFLPFGAGPRNCVAMRFALLEAKLALIHSLLQFKFEKCVNTPMKPKFKKLSGFLLCEDIFVKIANR